MISHHIQVIYKKLRQLMKPLLGKLIILTITSITIGTIGFYLLEYPLVTPLESFYWTVITITTIGFGDITPITMGGQILSVCLAFFGVAMISLTFAIIMEVLLESKLFLKRRFLRMVHKMDEVILVCGYNERVRILIQELTSEEVKIVLVSNAPVPDDWDAKWGAYIQGDPTKDEGLLKAGVDKAKKALISLDDDGDSLLSVLSIQSLNKDCFTIAEVKDKSSVQHFKHVNCHQIICQEEILGKFLNIVLLVPDIFSTYNELISMEGNEIYHIKRIDDLLDRTFEEAMLLVKKKHNAILVGLIRDDKTILNPDSSLKIQKSDILLVIAESFVEKS